MNHRTGSVLTEDLESYNQDWSKRWKGDSPMVLRPHSTDEVSSILKYCNTHNIKVVPQGGNTGLGSCVIGGNVSTNAGGQYYFRFGSLHANVLGLLVVLASGQVLNLLNTNLKDNTGYDLKHLFIGSEGTLGVITQVVLQCPTLPSSRQAVFVACEEYAHVLETLHLAKSQLGEILAAFEYMDQPVLDLVGKDKTIPLLNAQGANYPYCVLIETQGSSEEHDASKMQLFLETAMERNIIVDGIVAQDLQQVHNLWAIREYCGVVVAANGRPYKYDVSLPVSQFASVVADLKQRLSETHPDALSVNWGHIIDGNFHVNVLIPGSFEKDESLLSRLEPYLIDVVVGLGGSISAEHGLGQEKNKYMDKVKDPLVVQTMKSVKALLDPKGILNPGKYFPNDAE
ncbi:D-lactate dehydrogenase (cytochrome) [Fragilaria crotonensis]|nr:D-lactate dehydrogenase (cytochrome) [Fragilaria crotonensis]